MKLIRLLESMRKKMAYFLLLGILLMATGAIMILFHFTPAIIPVTILGTGSALIAVYLSTEGGTSVYDEMIGRINVLSGSYTNIATLILIYILTIINFFHPLPMGISTLLLILMLYMSILHILFRTFLRRRGKAE